MVLLDSKRFFNNHYVDYIRNKSFKNSRFNNPNLNKPFNKCMCKDFNDI